MHLGIIGKHFYPVLSRDQNVYVLWRKQRKVHLMSG